MFTGKVDRERKVSYAGRVRRPGRRAESTKDLLENARKKREDRELEEKRKFSANRIINLCRRFLIYVEKINLYHSEVDERIKALASQCNISVTDIITGAVIFARMYQLSEKIRHRNNKAKIISERLYEMQKFLIDAEVDSSLYSLDEFKSGIHSLANPSNRAM